MNQELDKIQGEIAIRLFGVASNVVASAIAVAARGEAASQSIAEQLEATGHLLPPQRGLLEALSEAALNSCGGDFGRALRLIQHTAALAPENLAGGPRATRPMSPTSMTGEGVELYDPIDELPGRYTHVSDHARGGMGRVLLVHDIKMGREVALKELLMPESDSPNPRDSPIRRSTMEMARFLREGCLTASLEHPGIVPVYELGRRTNGTLYYTMKLVRGSTFSAALRARKGLDGRLGLLRNYLDLCHAIAYAHSKGVIHRDIKPSNVMIGEFGETVVLDWGLAKEKGAPEIAPDGGADAPHAVAHAPIEGLAQTREGDAIGTPAYMPPEQALGKRDEIDEQSDVYSLGIVLYELLTGRTPYDGRSVSDVLFAVINEPVESPQLVELDAPPELCSICLKATSKFRGDRYASAQELASEIEAYLSGALVSAYRYRVSEVLFRYYMRHRLMFNTFGAAALVVLVTGVFSVLSIMEARDKEEAQRIVAEVARDQEAEARAAAAESAYAAQMRLASMAILQGDFQTAETQLWRTEEARRGWEWGQALAACNAELAVLRGHEAMTFFAECAADRSYILTAAGDRRAIFWEASAPFAERARVECPSLINTVDLSKDAARVALGLENGSILIVDPGTGEVRKSLEAHRGRCHTVVFSDDGRLLASMGQDGAVYVWDCATMGQYRALTVAGAAPVSADFVGNSGVLLVRTADERLRLWDYESGEAGEAWEGGMPAIQSDGARIGWIRDGVAYV